MRRQMLRALGGTLVVGSALVSGGLSLAQTASPTSKEAPRVDASALFTRLGCPLCHAPGARYHERIQQVTGKSEEDIARWIRNPEKFVPGTTMPTYASLVDEPSALALARWLKTGGPGAPTEKKK